MPTPDLASLRMELRSARVFEHRELGSWLELGVLFSIVAACLAAITIAPWWAIAPILILAGVVCTTAVMIGHEGSHRSFSLSPGRNALLVHLVFPLFGGLSARYWREKHDRLHHGHPNVDLYDPDIQPFPFVSSRQAHERSSRLLQWFHRHFQPWAFWPMSTLMTVGMRRSSLVFLVEDAKRCGINRGWAIDAGCIATHYICWLLVPSLLWSPLAAFGVYCGVWFVVGVLLAMIFAPAHIGLPIVSGQNHDWRHQLETTRNLKLPRLVSFFFMGLDYQIEHHLFPRIPHQLLPRAAEITESWCRRHSIPYLSVAYGDAFMDATRFMSTAWTRNTSSPDELRRPNA